MSSIPPIYQQIGAVSPVSPQEEKRLLKVVEQGQKATRLLLSPHNNDDEELYRCVQAGQEAQRRLVETNGRLVISIALKYVGRGLDLDELSQEGVVGLIRAIEKFKLSKGTKLSTYATFWIRQSIVRAIADKSRVIRLPVHQFDRVSKLKQKIGELTQELGCEPSLDEIAMTTGIPVKEVCKLLRHAESPLSLDVSVDNGGGEQTFIESIEDDDIDSPEQCAAKSLLATELERHLSKLSARESKILALRYGLVDGHTETLEVIANRYKLTRERIRQIEAAALKSLRRMDGVAELFEQYVTA